MLERKVNPWKGTLKNGSFKLKNVSKTEYMGSSSPDSRTIHKGFEPAVKSEKLRHLRSVVHDFGGIDHDVYGRVSAAWAKWREVNVVVCDHGVPPSLNFESIPPPVPTFPLVGD